MADQVTNGDGAAPPAPLENTDVEMKEEAPLEVGFSTNMQVLLHANNPMGTARQH